MMINTLIHAFTKSRMFPFHIHKNHLKTLCCKFRHVTEFHTSKPESFDKNCSKHMIGKNNLEEHLRDPVTDKLLNLTNYTELLQVIEENKINLRFEHASEILAKMAELNVNCFHKYKYSENEHYQHLRNICDEMINIFAEKSDCLTDDMLVNIVKHLKMLNFYLDHGNLITECENRIRRLPLQAVAIIFSCLHKENLQNLSLQIKILDLMDHYVDKCETDVDLCHIATCFCYSTIAGRTIKEKIVFVIKKFLENNKFMNFQSALASLKVLLSSPYLTNDKLLSEKLCTLLQNYVEDLEPEELLELHSVIIKQHIFDCTEIRNLISSRGVSLLNGLNASDQLKLLGCVTKQDLLKITDAVNSTIENAHQNMYFICHGPALLKIMYYLQIPHASILEKFWDTSIKCFGESKFELFMCKLYTKFKISFWGKYRHENFENILQRILMKKFDYSYLTPSQIVNICLFYIVSNGTSNLLIPNNIICQLQSMMHNFDMYCLSQISESIQSVFHKNRVLSNQMDKIFDWVIEEASHRAYEVGNLEDACNLISAVVVRTKTKNEASIENIMQQFLQFANELSPKTHRVICKNVALIAYYNPDLMDKLAEFVVNTNSTPRAAASVLFACYSIGYYPNRDNVQLGKLIGIIEKNRNTITGLKTLQSAMALSLFHHLPFSWIIDIFSVPFLDKLDEEIKGSGTLNYAKRIKHHLMELNQIACLEYPQFNIPWFNETYINVCYINVCLMRIILIDKHLLNLEFHKEVEETICMVLGSKNLFTEHVFAPYGYYLSFECLMDSMKTAIIHPNNLNQITHRNTQQTISSVPESCQRIAVNILRENSFCFKVHNLIGGQQIKQRHLEILEYKVVNIPYYEWYSLSLSDRKSRIRYLEKKLFS